MVGKMKFEYNIVAYVDILGFSDMVKSDCENKGKIKYFDSLFDCYSLLKRISADEGFWFVQFSDSLVVSTELSAASLIKIITALQKMQSELFIRKILCRGAISFGKHFTSENFLFSDGLINAYYLEKDIAKYPRIIIGKELLDLFSESFKVSDYSIIRENDDEYFLNYINLIDPALSESIIVEKLEESASSPRIRDKINWLAEYYNYSVGHQIKGYSGRFY
jgi:hypothetical protein